MSGLITRPFYPSGQNSQAGFSLIELIVVIIIMGVMVAMAAPNITASLDNQRNKQTVEMLSSAFREGRTQSQLLRQDVEVRLNTVTNTVTLSVRNPIGSTPPRTTLKEFSANKKAAIASTSVAITFKSNKSVVNPSRLADTQFKYVITCNKDSSKQGSTVIVDNNGNVKVDNGENKC